MNRKSPLYVIGFMAALCVLSGTGVAVVYNLTKGITERNEALNRNRAVAEAFSLRPVSRSAAGIEDAVAHHVERMMLDVSNRKREVFIRKEPPHDIGFIFSGTGFWDAITGILVLTPDFSTIVSVRFLEQHETPGLGARIEEPWFYRQFTGRNIAWEGRDDRMVVVGPGPKDQPNRVDAITGATQTSLALMRMLNRDLARFRSAYEAQTRLASARQQRDITQGERQWR